MYYLVVFWFGLSFITGLIISRKVFYSLIERTTSLLDSMLSDEEDEVKQRILIDRLTKLVVTLFTLVMVMIFVTSVSLLPGFAYLKLNHLDIQNLDFNSFLFYVVLITSSTLPFIVMKLATKKKDYSEWSILLHRIIFNNINLSQGLFRLEKRMFKDKRKILNDRFLIVSGLARAGTTALTTLLYNTNRFHSLSYANMPLLLSPNLWRFVYRPKNDRLRERSHGDRVMFGYNTVEALEEFFWAVQLKNNFVGSDTLNRHEVTAETYKQYLLYQSLINQSDTSDTLYLAKNNNFILRYESIRRLNPNFVIVILFRDPLEHAHSLLNQHERYCKFQQEDEFVKEYMEWLGHYEFGLNHKHFDFSKRELLNQYNEHTIDYWLRIWIDYYTFFLTLAPDPNLLLINYKDFLNDPKTVLKVISEKFHTTFSDNAIDRFENEKTINFNGDASLRMEAYAIYEQLVIQNKMTTA